MKATGCLCPYCLWPNDKHVDVVPVRVDDYYKITSNYSDTQEAVVTYHVWIHKLYDNYPAPPFHQQVEVCRQHFNLCWQYMITNKLEDQREDLYESHTRGKVSDYYSGCRNPANFGMASQKSNQKEQIPQRKEARQALAYTGV